ncbi:TPM domain-containing protein [bacterium]|nr:TPM domain-containing protein [bacterium]
MNIRNPFLNRDKDIKISALIKFAIFLAIIVLVIYPFSCAANAKETFFPAPQGYVTDLAKLLSSESVQHLNNLITYMKQKTGSEVAVVTLKTISPYNIEDYAVLLFEKWRIGQKDKDNGILILVAVEERKVRIEVGYGLEGAITDGTAGEIIRQVITPNFKQGRFDQGLLAGTESVLNLIAKEYGISLPDGMAFRTNPEDISNISQKSSRLGGIFSLLLFLFIFIFLIRSGLWPLLFLGFPGGGGWSSGRGGFSGGFGGFGGGMSGGGGASGGW